LKLLKNFLYINICLALTLVGLINLSSKAYASESLTLVDSGTTVINNSIQLSNGNILTGDVNRTYSVVNPNVRIGNVLQVVSNSAWDGQTTGVEIHGIIKLADGKPLIYGNDHWQILSVDGFTSLNTGTYGFSPAGATALPNGNYVIINTNGDWVICQEDGTIISSGTATIGIGSASVYALRNGNFIAYMMDTGAYKVLQPDGTILATGTWAFTNNVTLSYVFELTTGEILFGGDNKYEILNTAYTSRYSGDTGTGVNGWINGFLELSSGNVFASLGGTQYAIINPINGQFIVQGGIPEANRYPMSSYFLSNGNIISVGFAGDNGNAYFVLNYLATLGSSSSFSISLIGGSLKSSITAISFSNVALSNTSPMVSNANSTLSVIDSGGSGNGWSLRLSITDFVSDAISDPSGGNGSLITKIPASAVNFSVEPPTFVNGQTINSTFGPKNNTSGTLSTSDQTLISSSPGYGMGSYNALTNFTINFPKTTTITNITGTGSKYSVGNEIGTMASTYTATFTFTTVIGEVL
jgi:hypothetical protein